MLRRLAKNLIYRVTRIAPSFLIVGAQKAGTTSLYEHLTKHPQILPNRSWKEVRFFDVPDNYRQGMGWYRASFPTRREASGRISLDASPSYLYFPHVPDMIRKDLGDKIRMIAVLRNPTDRAYSAWKMYHSFATNENVAEVNRRIADRRPFAKAIDDEINGRIGPDMYPYAYVGRGLYADQIENYYRVFDRRNLLLLDFRRLRNDLDHVLDDVTSFLEIPPFTPMQKVEVSAARYNQGLAREKSQEDERTMQALRDYFRPHNARLEKLVGWNVDS